MKHKVVTIILIAIAVGLLAGGIAAYHTERGKAWAAQVAETSRQNTVERLRQQRVQQEYDRLNTECKAGQASWDGQTAVYKKTHARPVCDLQLVQ